MELTIFWGISLASDMGQSCISLSEYGTRSMNNTPLVSVILAGGAGTRLWPASRSAYPKPFMQVGSKHSLLELTIARGLACGASETMVVANTAYQFKIAESVSAIVPSGAATRLVMEPVGRNTAPAIAAAALDIVKRHGDHAVMLVLAADHMIHDLKGFAACVATAVQAAGKDELMVFGIRPTHPETGYGYLEVPDASAATSRVTRFVEKPDAQTAAQYLASGKYLWNSGMFCFKAKALLDGLQMHAPEVLASARASVEQAADDKGVLKLAQAPFAAAPNISIDYALMEKAKNVSVVPAAFDWSDVGSWPAVAEVQTADAQGNVLTGDVVAVDTRNTLVQTDKRLVATVGLIDMVVIDTADALLVAHKSKAQDVKKVVDQLKARKHESTELHATVHRPWGNYTTLEEGPRYKIKRIVVKPGQSLSLQLHHHRSEHWVVVSGTAKVTVGEKTELLSANESTYIPIGETHRLENPGKMDLAMIEVQCGDYVGEDDIVRLTDIYGRAS
jgi:mannose-1-phosphate guanylyltransferase / mannose-6-phosphate isomerase